MANDFSGDASCKALWRFEAGGLTTDSKSTNTLTNNGGTEETTNHMEGACAVALASGSSQYLNIPDANLVSGFPFKNGDTSKLATFSFWIRPTTVPTTTWACIIGKWFDTNRCFGIYLYNSKLRVMWGYGAGTAYENFETGTISANTKYHVVVTFDGVNKLLYVWIYNLSTGVLSSYSKVMTNELRVSDLDLRIGADQAGTVAYFNGVIDEVAVLNRMVNEIEAVKLRSGSYSAENQLDIISNYAWVEYNEESEAKASSVSLSVEWVPTDPNTHVYSGNIPLSITPQGTYDPVWQPVCEIPLAITPQGEYFFQPPGIYEYRGSIGISVTPSATTAHGFAYVSPGIPITVQPSCESLFPDRFYESAGIELTITPEATYRIPTPGFDNDSGYGAADLSFLDGPPPYYVIMGDMQVALDPLATSVNVYAEYTFEVSGGLSVGGECVFDESFPDEIRLTTIGGVKVGGYLEVDYDEPGVTRHVLKGGVEVGGKLGIAHVGFTEIPVTYLTTSRGVKVGGELGFEFEKLEELYVAITLSGGVVVGGIRRPPILTPDPTMGEDETVYEFETHGTIYAGGALGFDIPTPGVYEFELTRAQVKVGGACVFGFWTPPSIELELSGGVIVEGTALEEEAARFETWALSGFYFEPSIYGNFRFNSYAMKDGKCYAAGEDGIYLLGGGDDAGRPIHPGVRIGPTNLGFLNHKRLRAIYPGKKAGTPALRVLGNNGEESFCKLDDRTRFSVSQKVQDEVLTMEISDFTELSHLEFVPVIKAKR